MRPVRRSRSRHSACQRVSKPWIRRRWTDRSHTSPPSAPRERPAPCRRPGRKFGCLLDVSLIRPPPRPAPVRTRGASGLGRVGAMTNPERTLAQIPGTANMGPVNSVACWPPLTEVPRPPGTERGPCTAEFAVAAIAGPRHSRARCSPYAGPGTAALPWFACHVPRLASRGPRGQCFCLP